MDARFEALIGPAALGTGALVCVAGALSIATQLGRRARPRRTADDPLRYFVEFTADETAMVPARRAGAELRTMIFAIVLGATLMLAGGVVLGGRSLGRPSPARLAAPSGSTPPLPGAVQRVPRAAPPVVERTPRRASLFASPAADLNGDGKVQAEERAIMHAELPQFVLVTVEDAGSAEGIAWVQQVLVHHHLSTKATWFLAGAGFDRKGGPIGSAWQRVAFEWSMGLGAASPADAATEPTTAYWLAQLRSVQRTAETELELPAGWEWPQLTAGARAPYLGANDAWFSALVDARIAYDASLVVIPREAKAPDAPRDTLWPFTLHEGLPADARVPWVAGKAATIAAHPLWEIPVTAWSLRAKGQPPEWQASIDTNLFRFHPCAGDAADLEAVAALTTNLTAHYRGNRGPFHLGLRTSSYGKSAQCARATIDQFLADTERRIEEGENIRFVDAPTLLAWLGKKG